jgi:hypothetical protein
MVPHTRRILFPHDFPDRFPDLSTRTISPGYNRFSRSNSTASTASHANATVAASRNGTPALSGLAIPVATRAGATMPGRTDVRAAAIGGVLEERARPGP